MIKIETIILISLALFEVNSKIRNCIMKLIVFVIFFSSLVVNAQKTYLFDQQLTYNYSDKKFVKRQITYLINSKDNSYKLTIIKNDTDEYNLTFLDENGLFFRCKAEKKVIENEALNANCNETRSYSNPFKYQTKNYDFSVVKDTVVSGQELLYYSIDSNNKKRKAKKKLGKYVYLVNPTYDFLPQFSFHTGYEEWKLNRNIPNGLLEVLHLYDYKGEWFSTENLIENKAVSKKIIFQGC